VVTLCAARSTVESRCNDMRSIYRAMFRTVTAKAQAILDSPRPRLYPVQYLERATSSAAHIDVILGIVASSEQHTTGSYIPVDPDHFILIFRWNSSKSAVCYFCSHLKHSARLPLPSFFPWNRVIDAMWTISLWASHITPKFSYWFNLAIRPQSFALVHICMVEITAIPHDQTEISLFFSHASAQ